MCVWMEMEVWVHHVCGTGTVLEVKLMRFKVGWGSSREISFFNFWLIIEKENLEMSRKIPLNFQLLTNFSWNSIKLFQSPSIFTIFLPKIASSRNKIHIDLQQHRKKNATITKIHKKKEAKHERELKDEKKIVNTCGDQKKVERRMWKRSEKKVWKFLMIKIIEEF